MTQSETTAHVRLAALLVERGIEHVKIGAFDGDGILRGKYVNRAKFLSSLDKGLGFCDVVLGWDSNDQLIDNLKYTGWHTAFPDAPLRVLPDTWREIPFEPKSCWCCASLRGGPRACVRGPRCGACWRGRRPWAAR